MHLPQSTAYAPAIPATESAKMCTSHMAHDVNCAQYPLVCQHEVQLWKHLFGFKSTTDMYLLQFKWADTIIMVTSFGKWIPQLCSTKNDDLKEFVRAEGVWRGVLWWKKRGLGFTRGLKWDEGITDSLWRMRRHKITSCLECLDFSKGQLSWDNSWE